MDALIDKALGRMSAGWFLVWVWLTLWLVAALIDWAVVHYLVGAW